MLNPFVIIILTPTFKGAVCHMTTSGWNGYCSPNSKYWRELFLPKILDSVCNDIYTDYIYMDISNLIIYLILNKTILWIWCLHELLLEYSFHVAVLHVIVHRSINGTRHYSTSTRNAIRHPLQDFTYKHIVRLRYDAIYRCISIN